MSKDYGLLRTWLEFLFEQIREIFFMEYYSGLIDVFVFGHNILMCKREINKINENKYNGINNDLNNCIWYKRTRTTH